MKKNKNAPNCLKDLKKTCEEIMMTPLDVLCKVIGADVTEITSRRRSRLTVDQRAALAKYYRLFEGMTYEKIGKIMQKDHSTIYNLVNYRPDTDYKFTSLGKHCFLGHTSTPDKLKSFSDTI